MSEWVSVATVSIVSSVCNSGTPVFCHNFVKTSHLWARHESWLEDWYRSRTTCVVAIANAVSLQNWVCLPHSLTRQETYHFLIKLHQHALVSVLFDVHSFNWNSVSRKLCSHRLSASDCTGIEMINRTDLTVKLLCQGTSDFTSPDLWPPNSPHLTQLTTKLDAAYAIYSNHAGGSRFSTYARLSRHN